MTSANDVDKKLTEHFQTQPVPQRRISDILAQVDALCENAGSKEVLPALVLKLREANQNLVNATFAAQDLQAAAEATSRAKEEFLSMLAHELRNPLAPIVMATSMLGTVVNAHPQLPKIQGILSRQVGQLIHLVDQLLDASRMNGGKISLESQALLLSAVIATAVETSQPSIDRRHQSLALDLPESAVHLHGDPVRLAQLFSNLLINASKFTPEQGHISVTARIVNDTVRVSVLDDGIGMDPDLLPLVFDLFKQGPRSLDRSQGGLGIGLSLVSTIANLHGGTVEARSDGDGQGSEFVVTLPLTRAQAPEIDIHGSPMLRTGLCRILIIEDNVDANQILNDVLALEGYTIVSTFDGPGGLEMARQHCFDVIICDIGLPGLSGYEIVRQLSADEALCHPLFIALTGYDHPGTRMQAKEVGFDHYLVKPVDVDSLLNLISTRVLQ